MRMCELSLPQTGLASRQNAEILERDFEQEWFKNNGAQYLQRAGQQISSVYLKTKLGIRS